MKDDDIHTDNAHFILLVGEIALLYGVVNYIRVTYFTNLMPYATYMAGGLILILFGWWKMKMK